MIYAVNKRTKEHRVTTRDLVLPWADWEFVEAGADGWIEWDGKVESPVPVDSRFEIRLRSGVQGEGLLGKWVHGHEEMSFDIIAYRPVLAAKPEAPIPEQGTDATTPRRPFLDSGRMWSTKPEAPEWNGGGLPPVGVVCEVDIGSWVECEIIAHFKQRLSMVAAFITPYPNSDGAVRLDSLVADHFRPIRSEEDRAVEEMYPVIDECHADGPIEIARALCRAGYRKAGDE